MNTLNEISSSKGANYAFWTQCARLNLVCYREHKRDGLTAYANLERAGFRKAIKNRRERVYYDD